MPTAAVSLASIAGTEAAAGWAAGHTVVVDRPEGVAGGRGLGFNGAQLLALDMEGDALVATGATVTTLCAGAAG